jgi:hypothetical protein
MDNNTSTVPVSSEYLLSLLRKAFGEQAVELLEWESQRLKGGFEIASAIHRLEGSVLIGGEMQPWSLILKSIQPEEEFNDQQGYRYWMREIQAYQSGMLEGLPGQIRAPRCYDIQENPDGSVWLWLEDIQDEVEHPWPLERYARVSRQLGAFNGSYLAGSPLPGEGWITHDWLLKYLDRAVPMVEFIHQNPGHPTVQLMLPGITLPLTLAIWDEHVRMLKVLEEMPQTFCHQDAFGLNLFCHGDQLIAIDWGYAGLAPLGSELAPLIGVAFSLAKFPSSQARELDQACFDGYLEGLRQVGLEPDSRQVRICYCITMLLRYIIGATVGEILPGLMDEATRDHFVEGLEADPERAGESEAGIVAYYQSIAMEALKLLGLGTMLRVIARTLGYAVRLARVRRETTSPAA